MWSVERSSRPSSVFSMARSPSIRSSARSVTSSRGSSYEENVEEEYPPQMWQPSSRQNSMQEFDYDGRESISSEHPTLLDFQEPPAKMAMFDDPPQRSIHSLSFPEDETDPKTPTVREISFDRVSAHEPVLQPVDEPIYRPVDEPMHRSVEVPMPEPANEPISRSVEEQIPKSVDEPIPESADMIESQAPTVADQPIGPLEAQLLSLLSKVSMIERDQPTIMAEDYKELEDKVAALERERKTWLDRHEGFLLLRDGDVVNLIKIRGELAEERKQHQEMKRLRDEDLQNVLELRNKLAQFNWTKPESRLDKMSKRMSRAEGSDLWQAAKRVSKPEGSDLWQAAKTAAMEHRVLELEQANEELLRQVETKGHWGKMEALFEENLKYREKMAQKVQQLRSEREAMQKELARLEDENHVLQARVERYQMKAN